MTKIDEIISGIVKREGGYVNHPNDKGGPTNFGITLGTLKAHRNNQSLTADDVRNMPRSEAEAIYRFRYIQKPGFDQIKDEALLEQVIDAGVNHGVTAASMFLQRAVGVRADGKVGPQTIAALEKLPRSVAFARFTSERALYFGAILEKNKSQLVFAAGWFNRLAHVIDSYADAIMKEQNEIRSI